MVHLHVFKIGRCYTREQLTVVILETLKNILFSFDMQLTEISIAENKFSILMLRFQWNYFLEKQDFTSEVLYRVL